MRRLLLFCATLACVVFAPAAALQAQGGPSTDTLDAIFRDISQRTGLNISRTRLDGTWTWEEIQVADNNLGCPVGGQAAPGQTRAWKVVVNVTGVGTYDYRVSKDERVLFFCTGTGLGTSAPIVITPGVSSPPAIPAAPVTYQGQIAAYIGADGNVYVVSLGTNALPTPITGDAQGRDQSVMPSYSRMYGGLQWSPDGSRLLFAEFTTSSLYVAATGQAPVRVARGISLPLVGTWSPDGSEIAFAVSTGQSLPSAGGVETILQIQAVPAAGGQARVAGQITFGLGCGGGGWGPSTQLYYSEAGYGGNNQPLVWLPQGFLHAGTCVGDSLVLTGFNGQKLWALPNLARTVIAPDRRRAAAVQLDANTRSGVGISIIDLATGTATPINTQPNPDQLAWSGDGASLIYSTRTPGATLPGLANAPLGLQLLPAWPNTAQSFTLNLWTVPVTGGLSAQVYTGEGFAIGQIAPSPTAGLAVFSVIESEIAMFSRINANDTLTNVLAAAPRVKLGVVALAAGTAGYPYFISGNGGQPTVSRAAQFVAVPAAAVLPPPPPVTGTGGGNPFGLTVGGRAYVPPGGNVNVRTAPTLRAGNNVAGILLPGDTTTILAGPVLAEGLRWWQVRRDADGLNGWVVDQFVNASGVVENNLLPLR